ncbi:MAG: Holliday junction branch migration protein RuvA [Desulfobulbaceae bacterium]|jgi:Holliday junction DNA helicase RuvA|nr:Holliday junction branch migration protein RuvA [Desulfobulbaceae bacterium]
MIASLTGLVQSTRSDRVVLDVGGVGYEVFLAADAIARLPERGEVAFLHIHTQVREDAIVLFGFLQEAEKEMFLALKTVSGVGPKLALAALSGMRLDDLSQAIAQGDVKRLTSLPGIGKRTAERICVELKGKIFSSASAAIAPRREAAFSARPSTSVAMDALSALVNLGYADPVAREALGKARLRLGDEAFAALTFEEIIRESLKVLA